MEDKILLGHGSGGLLTHQLIEEVFMPAFGDSPLKTMDDATLLNVEGHIVVSTDTFTVNPLFFPGGDIGTLAVNGTVNDVAVSTGKPLYLTVGFVIEEGFSVADLKKIVMSMKEAAERVGVKIVAGDTKVVEKGKADGVYINTTGIGIYEGLGKLSREPIKPGDKVIVSGPIGDHAATIMINRENLGITADIQSDCGPVVDIVKKALEVGGVKWMRDPTRGGVGTTLNELAMHKDFGVLLFEENIPIRDEVRGISELLGIDPLYMACEGRVLLVVEENMADKVLETIKSLPEAKDSAIIGEIEDKHPGKVRLKTRWAERFVPMLPGQQLPRIC